MTKLTREERINDIKNMIRNSGIDRLPTYRELGKKYGVSKSAIFKDMDLIISQMDQRELDETFTNFYQSDLRALEVIKMIIHTGSNQERINAIKALSTLQESCTKLLEAFSRKSKVADKMQLESVTYNFHISQPEENKIFEIKKDV